jgi:PAS domain S-box-containing protein
LPLSLVGTACVAAAIVAAAGLLAARERASVLWTVAWASVLAAGALALAPSPGALLGLAFVSPFFPGCQLLGACAATRGSAPVWLVAATIGVATARALARAGGFAGVELVGVTLEPVPTLIAAWLLARTARREPSSGSLVAVVALLVAAAFAYGVTGWTQAGTGAVPLPIGLLWVGLLAVGLPLQLRLASRQDLRRQAGLRERAEAELIESRERFRALTESAFDLVAELDGDERFTYVNPRYEEVLGYPRESLIGMRAVDLLDPLDRAAAARFAELASREGRAASLIVRARHAAGHDVWVECAASVFTTPDGQRRWVMTSQDVTDRRAREERGARMREELELAVRERTAALEASEARFRALAEHAPELISEFDDRGRYTFANESFRDLLGRDPATLIGTVPESLIHPDDMAASRSGMARAFLERGTARALHRLRHADGSWRWFDNTGRAYYTVRGELRFVSMGRDVTEARHAEAERERLAAHMQEVQRLESLGVMAGGIAHDFNNLLAVILGNAALLDEDAGDDEELRGRLRRIVAASRHAEALTDQMLAYAGKSVAELVPLDLSALVRQTEDLLRASISKKSALVLELGSDLPAVRGDPTRLRQVLLNLVTNASEAIGEGATGTIRVRTDRVNASCTALADAFGSAERPEGTWALLEVADDGPGIDEALRGRIFEPFFSSKGAGRGLGLAAVLGIARAHGGLVRVNAAEGGGTRIGLLLPPSAPLPAVASATPAEETSPAPPGLVLVVDDDEAVREIAEALLRKGGFRVETAAGGREALARVRAGGVGALLLDLVMPELSGADVLRILATEQPDLPVVVASGYKRELASDRLGREGAFALVQKPFDPDALCAILRDALRKRQMARTMQRSGA